MSENMSRLAFVDAVAIPWVSSEIYIASSFSGFDVDASRMLLLEGTTKWRTHDVHSKVVSVDAHTSSREFYALGRDGLVSVASEYSVLEERIEDAGINQGKMGYVTGVKAIGDTIYVCGDLKQVYRRTSAGWAHMDQDIRVRDVKAIGQSLNSIDGSSESDIYAVGDRGVILHFDGSSWEDAQSPTNRSLQCVRCLSSGDILISGKSGVLLKGEKDKWRVLGDSSDPSWDFWGVEQFQGEVYVATSTKVFSLRRERFEEILLPSGDSLRAHRLTSSEDTLWAVGLNHIYCLHQQIWREIIYPGNM